MGMVVGYAVHDLRQFRHTYVLNDLSVLRVISPSEFVMEQDQSHIVFNTKFCPDYLPAFNTETKIKILVYEDRGACWSISDEKLGYILNRKGE